VKARFFSTLLIAALMGAATATAVAADLKIGYVNSDRVLRDSAPAKRALERINKEFSKRQQDLQRQAKDLEALQKDLEANGAKMAEADRRRKERDLSEGSRDFQRKQREFQEDVNQRNNEELSGIVDKVNAAIKQIATGEKYDLILQEAVYFNPQIDITDKVIKAMSADK